MSVWKKASKANQKTHRERHQPDERKHLGLLEKKKDYVQRASDFSDKKTTLRLLRKRALNKNADEFYHHMVNAKVEDGRHIEREQSEDEDTPEQRKFNQTQDLRYVSFKRTQELRKIERLQSQLHMTNVKNKQPNVHIVYKKNVEPDSSPVVHKQLANVDENALMHSSRQTMKAYNELAKRIEREKELEITQQKLETKRMLESGRKLLKPEKIKKASKHSAAIYKWKYERKK